MAGVGPKPRLSFRRLWMKHKCARNFAVAISHIVIIRRPPIAATAFAGGDQNKLTYIGRSHLLRVQEPVRSDLSTSGFGLVATTRVVGD
jgi:hypothetical protein